MEHETITLYCENCGHPNTVTLRCGDRTCSRCRRQDYYRLKDKYSSVFKDQDRLIFLTLTLKNTEILTDEIISHLRSCFTKLRRKKYYSKRIKGGLYTIECKHGKNGWNVHLHAVLNSFYLPQEKLSQDWKEITGGSYVVHIERVNSGTVALNYLLKYISKEPETDGKKQEFNAALRGSRLIQSFGIFFNYDDSEVYHLECPNCGSIDWVSEFELRRLLRSGISIELFPEKKEKNKSPTPKNNCLF